MHPVPVEFNVTFLSLDLSSQNKDGWTSLFDLHSLKGWKVLGGKGLFTIEQDAIVGTSVVDTANTFLVTEKEYGDFILELDVMIESPLSNSGIQTRSHFGGKVHERKVYGRQMEIDPFWPQMVGWYLWWRPAGMVVSAWFESCCKNGFYCRPI